MFYYLQKKNIFPANFLLIFSAFGHVWDWSSDNGLKCFLFKNTLK